MYCVFAMRSGSVKLGTITYWEMTIYCPMAGPSLLDVITNELMITEGVGSQ